MESKINELFSRLEKALGYDPTAGQGQALQKLANFIIRSTTGDTYLLKGYAGTGKTSIVAALVKTLPFFGINTVLLAPTGRAAKVMASYAGKSAHTIHRRIYRVTRDLADSSMLFRLAPNKSISTLFIVDEASMIPESDTSSFGTGSNLLSDLIEFVKSGDRCRLLLVGDNAQLPPVGQLTSPALEIKKLSETYGLRSGHFELTDVVRQEAGSGILKNATDLRDQIRKGGHEIFLQSELPGVKRLQSFEVGEQLSSVYGSGGIESTVVICRSNRTANQYNKQIRYSGLWFEDEISAGDFIMCVRNNYFWLDEKSSQGFIANGDILKVTRVNGVEEKFGFRFADISVQLPDEPGEPALEVKVVLDSLYTDSPALTKEQSSRLFHQVASTYNHITQKRERQQAVTKDPWYQALQIKFSYALTCHKAQGGQWANVFVDQGYLTEEMIDTGYLRWLYTAITRATGNLYLVNFHERFFENKV